MQGSAVQAGGNLLLQAGRDLGIRASQAQAGEGLAAIAGRDLTVGAITTTELASAPVTNFSAIQNGTGRWAMNRIFSTLIPSIALLALVGCASQADLYRSMGPPVKRSLDYPICTWRDSPDILLALALRVERSGPPPRPERFDEDEMRGDPRRGCRPEIYPGPRIRDSDRLPMGRPIGVDYSGQYQWYSSHYKTVVLNAEDLRREEEAAVRVEGYRSENFERDGVTINEVLREDERERLGGVEWHRTLRAKIRTTTYRGEYGRLLSLTERYEYWVDREHVVRVEGNFGDVVADDPQWLAARRDLLRRMVEQTRIQRLSPSEVAAYREQYERKRAERRGGKG